MPTISVNRDVLFSLLGRSFTKEEFEELCFEFGIELDEETTESQLCISAKGETSQNVQVSDVDTVIYRIEVSANRIDLLCVEGLARALRTFMYEDEALPVFKPITSLPTIEVNVSSSTSSVRPYIVAAVLENVTFTPESYKSFIDLQDKLHQNYCRRRTLVAIGTHDLDTLTPPFLYTSKATKDISFVALNQTEEKTADALLASFSEPGHYLRPYVNIVQDHSNFPVIYDSKGILLSLPPVINGDYSKIKTSTRNIFVECTAVDRTKAYDVLATIVSVFSGLCESMFSYRPVTINYSDGSVDLTPRMESRNVDVSLSSIRQMIGVDISVDDAVKYLKKMMLPSVSSSSSTLSVTIPPTRTDVLHPCDVVEDATVAFGFSKIPKKLPEFITFGQELPSTELVEQLRIAVSTMGFVEISTFTLISAQDYAFNLGIEDDGVIVANPKGSDFERVRKSLIPGLLKTAGHNKGLARPLKLFEIGDVVVLDSNDENGAINKLKFGALFSSVTAGFEYLHGVVDRLTLWLGLSPNQLKLVDQSKSYLIEGNQASIVYTNSQGIETVVGEFGVVSIPVLKNFDCAFPCSVLEIDLECFV
ncbi:hypothetical protein RCL1_003135 [Eukaryota sp. TZLM3-RCL]